MTPKAAALHFRRAEAAVPAAVLAAETEMVKAAKEAAVRLSSGQYSAAQLRAAGHPYARRAPNAAYDAAIINAQTGRFRSAFAPILPVLSGGTVRSAVINNSPEARYMTGTRSMIARPIAARTQQTVQPARLLRLRRAIRRAYLTP